MIWKVEWLESARREFRKLDHVAQKKIIRFLREKIATNEDPKRFGKPLKSNLKGLWRYRLEDYRLICKIENDCFTVLLVRVAHRRDIYRR